MTTTEIKQMIIRLRHLGLNELEIGRLVREARNEASPPPRWSWDFISS